MESEIMDYILALLSSIGMAYITGLLVKAFERKGYGPRN